MCKLDTECRGSQRMGNLEPSADCSHPVQSSWVFGTNRGLRVGLSEYETHIMSYPPRRVISRVYEGRDQCGSDKDVKGRG